MDKKIKKDIKRYEKPKIMPMAGLKESLGADCGSGGWGCEGSCGAGSDASSASCGSGGSPAS
jgi:hypothetical protein